MYNRRNPKLKREISKIEIDLFESSSANQFKHENKKKTLLQNYTNATMNKELDRNSKLTFNNTVRAPIANSKNFLPSKYTQKTDTIHKLMKACSENKLKNERELTINKKRMASVKNYSNLWAKEKNILNKNFSNEDIAFKSSNQRSMLNSFKHKRNSWLIVDNNRNVSKLQSKLF